MQLAKITSLNKHRIIFLSTFFLCGAAVKAQDNSPYSRYGLGNEFPRTNVVNRGMGGVSAGYIDVTSVNYNNPASYAKFQAYMEQRSGKVSSARVILDVGVDFTSRKLTQPNTANSFRASDALFSHVYVGIPIRKNWGLAFGIRPLTRISYDIFRTERLFNPNPPGGSIDSAITQFTGTGGSFLPTIGTGFGNDHLSVGFNVGYLFGKKELVTRRALINDTVEYAASNHTTNTTFGNVFFDAGAQYTVDLTKRSLLRFGASGNWKQTINGSQDILRQTYVRNSTGQELQVDSVFNTTGVAGKIIYPASYTAGVYYEKGPGEKTRGFSLGLDYVTSKWDSYRFFEAKDFVQNSWEVRMGGQLTPVAQAASYGQAITYRFGAFAGTDYVKADNNNLPVYGLSFGVGLPIRPSRQSPNQFSIVNLAVEYTKRGNEQNKIKEDLIRFSLGFNFTDLWFGKRKYD
ncbi:MAG: hypothetical protein JWR72_488 [Flavisolibacter sp.]|jgi:hypothetical protein|nr:hypothetical protein [Flavisolibacter sp.]